MSIFGAAIEQAPPAERGAYVDDACAGNLHLRREVEDLLAAHDRLGGGLGNGHPPGPVATLDGAQAERPGMAIGPYKLLQQLGDGGMGVVYMAEQEQPLRRRVA